VEGSLTAAVLLLDSAVMLAVGYRDLKNVEFDVRALPPLLLAPALLYLLYADLPFFAPLAIAVNAAFATAILLGLVGLMDLAVSARLPLLLALSHESSAWAAVPPFVAGVIVAYAYFHHTRVKPILCPGSGLLGQTKMVRREAVTRSYIMPPGLPMEAGEEEVEKWRESALKSGSECVEAVVGVPLLFVFSAGYALSVLATYLF